MSRADLAEDHGAGALATPGAELRGAPAWPSANQGIADKLRQVADLLARQGANPFRVSAYRRAADAVVHAGRDLRRVLDGEGVEGLLALPHVGQGIAAAIVEMLRTGRWSQLDRLRGTLDPVRVYHYDDDHREGQDTVVTETQGPLAGQRVVRGREAECHGLRARLSRRARIRSCRRRPHEGLATPPARA